MKWSLINLFVLVGLGLFNTFEQVTSEKILVVAFFGSKSHKNVFDPLYQELIRKGHQLTFIHPVKSHYGDKLVKEINGVSMHDAIEKQTEESGCAPPNPFDMRLNSMKLRTPIHPVLIPIISKGCKSYYEMPEVQTVLKQKFALVIAASHMNECMYGILHKLNTSYIFVHPHAMEHYKSVFTGFRMPSSFVPTYTTGGTTDRMNFVERVMNFVAYQFTYLLYEWIYIPQMESVYRSYLGADTPSVREIEKNASLVLNNAHFTLNYPRPLMPQVIDVAGMHCRPGQPLPKDLQDFLDSSGPDGFILFSLGSHVQAKQMPENARLAFLNAFSKLKQKVLWKWDTDTMEGVPKNVKIISWVPQQDVLAHGKIKAFITHGGLLSTEESIFHGVPLIGFPLFGDQDSNMRQAEANGYAITLELVGLTEEHISAAINKILTEPSYQNRAKELAKTFQDRPEKAIETALFWTEYVIRHKGALHLRSPAQDLNAFAYYSLDVLLLLIFVLSLVFYIIITLFKICCCRKSGSKNRAVTSTIGGSGPRTIGSSSSSSSVSYKTTTITTKKRQ